MINWILLSFAGFVILLGFYFATRGLFLYRGVRSGYNVGRQEARLARRNDLLRGIIAVFLGAILLLSTVFWSDFTLQEEPAAQSTASPWPATATTTPTSTLTPTVIVLATVPPTALTAAPPATVTAPPVIEPVKTSSPSLSATPNSTQTVAPQTAVVNSGVGVWLRATPSVDGEQLEWVLDGTVLILLDQVENTAEFSWQYVQTPAGNVGWVAASFIELNQ